MKSNINNEYMGNEYGHVKLYNIPNILSINISIFISHIFIMNIWGMNMDMLMLGILGMVGSVDRCNVRSECGNRGMLGVNALISAI